MAWVGLEPTSLDFQSSAKTSSATKPDGGTGEIRTHGPLSGPLVFKTSLINRSSTVPEVGCLWSCVLSGVEPDNYYTKS